MPKSIKNFAHQLDRVEQERRPIIDEVKRKESPAEKENYTVPDLNLYRVSLSEILQQIYQKFVCTKRRPREEEVWVNN